MRVVGAGFPRTATTSLSLALPMVLDEPCFHQSSLFEEAAADIPTWQRAVDDGSVDWPSLLAGYGAAVDWPASLFWRELAEVYPDAVILLSVRRDAATWWRSMDRTVMEAARHEPGTPEWSPPAGWHRLLRSTLARGFGGRWDDADAARHAYDAHIADVRANAPADRLVVWRAEEGWEPLCAALGVPVPDEPFPRVNTAEEWVADGAE